MSYEVIAVDEFQKDVKKLYKKYKSIKISISIDSMRYNLL